MIQIHEHLFKLILYCADSPSMAAIFLPPSDRHTISLMVSSVH